MFNFPKRKFKITKAGYSFMLITLGIGIAGLNTGNNLLYLLFGMMLSFILMSGILSDSSMRRLRVKREIPQEITANSYFPVKVNVENRKKRVPSYSLTVDDIGQQRGKNTRFIVKIPPQGRHDIFYFSKFLERGWKKYYGFEILTKFPFGLIQKTDFLKQEEEVLVYPEIIDLKGFIKASQLFHGEYLSGNKGVGVNPWGLRSYLYGDDARLIHWKSTAKKGQWMVKEFESEKKMSVVVDLNLVHRDISRAGVFQKKSQKTMTEKLISICASMIIFLIRENYEVVLTVNGKPAGSEGRGYISSYLKNLALLTDEDFIKNSDSIGSPVDGGSMHILITNISVKNTRLSIENLGLIIDRDNYESVLISRDVEGEKPLEL